MRSKLPTNPIITPKTWLLLKFNPNAKIPKINVFNGVSELRIALIELSIWVSAIEKRKAGINVPNKDVTAIYFHFPWGIFGKVLNPIAKRKTAAKIIRNEPSWNGVNPTNPLLISIKELPQIKAKKKQEKPFGLLWIHD